MTREISEEELENISAEGDQALRGLGRVFLPYEISMITNRPANRSGRSAGFPRAQARSTRTSRVKGKPMVKTRSKSGKLPNQERIVSRMRKEDNEIVNFLRTQRRTVQYTKPIRVKFDLLELPAELRMKVYESVVINQIDTQRTKDLEAANKTIPRPREPALSKTSRLVRHEFLPIFYRNTTFECNVGHAGFDFYHAKAWIFELPPHYAQLIRRIEFDMSCCGCAVEIWPDPLARFIVRVNKHLSADAVVHFKGNQYAAAALNDVQRRVTAHRALGGSWEDIDEDIFQFWSNESLRHSREIVEILGTLPLESPEWIHALYLGM